MIPSHLYWIVAIGLTGIFFDLAGIYLLITGSVLNGALCVAVSGVLVYCVRSLW